MTWLNDMIMFYTELKVFLKHLPADVNIGELETPSIEVLTDGAYRHLVRVSNSAHYLDNIPLDQCREEVETVQDMSREAFELVNAHPVLRVFSVTGRKSPFFERVMILGSSLAVEHGIAVHTAARDARVHQRQLKKLQEATSASASVGLVIIEEGGGTAKLVVSGNHPQQMQQRHYAQVKAQEAAETIQHESTLGICY